MRANPTMLGKQRICIGRGVVNQDEQQAGMAQIFAVFVVVGLQLDGPSETGLRLRISSLQLVHIPYMTVPMTSPVDFISGHKIGSASGNLWNGNPASLTEKYGGMLSLVRPCIASVL